MAWAVVSGASSGIGRDIARILADNEYDLVLVARRTDRIAAFSEELRVKTEIIGLDLSERKNCFELFDKCKDKDIEILVNNAGFGIFGEFSDTELNRDLEMISLNTEAVHILTKLFLKEFLKKNKGKILNVASAAGFMPAGPLLSGYYATKAYVLTLTRSIAKELKMKKSNVTISALCPGPVKTEFDRVAGVEFGMAGMSSKKVARIAVDGMFKGKTVITPGLFVKLGRILTRLLPDSVTAAFAYKFQNAKKGNN